MVECESESSKRSKNTGIVLIDTWWNVNDSARSDAQTSSQVLIDTWWNVNDGSDTLSNILSTF